MNQYIEVSTDVVHKKTTKKPVTKPLKSILKQLREHSAFLSDIERNLKLDWNQTQFENPTMLFNPVCSVWLAGKKLVAVREEIHSVVSLFCPPAYLMTILELDKVWEEDYILFDAEIASICTSESSALSSISILE